MLCYPLISLHCPSITDLGSPCSSLHIACHSLHHASSPFPAPHLHFLFPTPDKSKHVSLNPPTPPTRAQMRCPLCHVSEMPCWPGKDVKNNAALPTHSNNPTRSPLPVRGSPTPEHRNDPFRSVCHARQAALLSSTRSQHHGRRAHAIIIRY